MHFCEGMDNSFAMIRLQARHLQASLEYLADIIRGRDWELRAQVALWVAAGSFILPFENIAALNIRKSCEAINTAGLQFIPTYGRPPEFSEHLHEKLSILSQAIYFENFLFLTCGGAEPTMTARIENEFRYQLQVGSTSSYRLHPVFSVPNRKSTQCCSKYVRWPCARKRFCWSGIQWSHLTIVQLTVSTIFVRSYRTNRRL